MRKIDMFSKKSIGLALVTLVVCASFHHWLVPVANAKQELTIRRVNIVDVENKRIVRNRDIVIKNGTILKIRRSGSHETGARQVFDADGAYAIPGLYDAHVHVNTSTRLKLMLPALSGMEIPEEEIRADIAPYLAYGVVGIVVLGGGEETLKIREDSYEATNFLPYVTTSPLNLDGAATTNPSHQAVNSEAEGVAAVEDAKRMGYDLIKIYHIDRADIRNAIIKQASEYKMPVVAHLPPSMTLETAIAPGLTNIAHAEEITRTWDGQDPRHLTEAIEKMNLRNVTLTPNLVVYREIVGQLEDLDAHLQEKDWSLVPPLARIYSKAPYNGYVEKFGDPEKRSKYVAYFRREASGMDELTKLAKSKGIRLLAGTDAGNPTMYPGQSLYEEMRLLSAAGLDGYEVIAAATINVTTALKPGMNQGLIKEGFVADIVLMKENPVENGFRGREQLSAVVKGGVVFDGERIEEEVEKLEKMFRRREALYQAALGTGESH